MAENIMMSEMSWTEVEEALKERPVALIPVGAFAAHGPHLPLVTDTVIARELARRGAAKLKAHGVASLILPPVPFVVAEWGAEFPGSLSLPVDTATALLRDLAVAASRHFRAVVYVNALFEPAHLECLKQAVEQAEAKGANATWLNLTKKRWEATLGASFRQADHAGPWETSVMLAVAPEQVRDSVRRSLPPIEGVPAALRKGAATLAAAGAEDGYSGDPTAANAEEGSAAIEAAAEVLSLSVMEFLGSKG
jgi:creatinine amidohydrolase